MGGIVIPGMARHLIDFTDEAKVDLAWFAEGGLAPDGREFIPAEADDFEAEVEALRNSACFQSFLDERMADPGRTSIDDIEKELAAELAR